MLHTVKFAVDGVGFAGLAAAGDVLDIMSRVSDNNSKISICNAIHPLFNNFQSILCVAFMPFSIFNCLLLYF